MLSALYFPETIPDPKVSARLLLFFETITHYQPSEDATGDATTGEEILRGYPPAPLGDDLEEFNRTLKHLRNRQDPPGHLRSLSLAALSDGFAADKDEASSAGLVTAMLRQGRTDHTGQNIGQPELWQARLVLRLAEALDLEEREINQGFASIANHEHQLFESLRGPENGEETSDAEDKNLSSLANPLITLGLSTGSPNTPIPEHRIKAWARLFLADQTPQRPHLLATTRPEAADLLFENYEKLTKQQPVQLFAISLPDLPELSEAGWADQDYRASRAAFRADRTPDLQAFENALQKAGADKPFIDNTQEHQALQEKIAAWNKAAADMSGPTSQAEGLLTFYCLPDITTNQLLAHICGANPPEQTGNESYRNVLLATFT